MEMPDVIYVEHSADEWVNGKYTPLYEGGTKWDGSKTEYHHSRIVEALRRENEELKAKLDKAKWQPIETLPQKDFMFTGYSKAYGAIPIRLTAAVDSDGNDLGLKFFCGITWGDAICVSDITHWMPLPAAPEQH